MAEAHSLWRAVLQELQAKLDLDSYERYVAGIIPLRYDAAQALLTLGVLNDFVSDWLAANYQGIFEEALHATSGRRVSIKFEAGHTPDQPGALATGAFTPALDLAPLTTPQQDVESAEEERDRACHWRPDFTFDSYIVGNNNRMSVAAAQAVCLKPGRNYNPFFIHGGSGLGKTHLLHAIANAITAKRKRAKVEYVTSEEFLNHYIEALQNKTLPSFRKHYRSLDVLLIDDVQFFAGKVGLSEEFFHTFNTLHNAHRQIVMACDRQPRQIAGLEERLVSRFEWGMSAEVLPPDELETRMAILKKKRDLYGIKVPDECLLFIAQRIHSNIRNLESALKKLVMYVSANGEGSMAKPLTLELAAELLRDKIENETSRQLTIETIQRRVAEHYDIRVADMTSPRRPANIAQPRMLAMYLARKLTQKSLPAIGEAFLRDHATVINAVRTVEKRMAADETFKHTVSMLARQLHG